MPGPHARVGNLPQKPVFLFDGECGFCRRWVRRLERVSRRRVAIKPYQENYPKFPEISLEEFEKSVRLVETNGCVYSGAAAAYKAMEQVTGLRWVYWLYDKWPLFAKGSEKIYDVVSQNRYRL